MNNSHSDAIAYVMENYSVGSWWSELSGMGQVPFPDYHFYLTADKESCPLKEIFFTLMWIVDDETLNEIIKELQG